MAMGLGEKLRIPNGLTIYVKPSTSTKYAKFIAGRILQDDGLYRAGKQMGSKIVNIRHGRSPDLASTMSRTNHNSDNAAPARRDILK